MAKIYVLSGPEMGRSFQLSDDTTYVGRSIDNEVQITDSTVSRTHLKIVRRGNRYFITDLESRNGTFLNGSCIPPGLEVEVKEGVPIAIGMTVICLGRGCIEQILPFLDSIDLNKETGEESGIFSEHRDKTNQRKLEFFYRISDILMENLPLSETLQKILDHIFVLLGKIDRGAFVLVDPESEKIVEVIAKANKPGHKTTVMYCPGVVRRVIETRTPLVVSNVETEDQDDLVDTLRIFKIGSVMCVPLISRPQILGALYVDSLERPYGFRKEDLSLFLDLAQRIAIAIESARFAFDLTTIADNMPFDMLK